MSHDFEGKSARRGFLRGTAIGALLVAAAVAAPTRALSKPGTKEVRKKSRYHETVHVKRFYDSNRY